MLWGAWCTPQIPPLKSSRTVARAQLVGMAISQIS